MTLRLVPCLIALGFVLFLAGIGLVPTLAIVKALESALRDVIPPDPLLILLILTTFVLWPLFSVGVLYGLVAILPRTEDRRRQQFENRPALSAEEFARLLPDAPERALAVRAELGQLIERAEVAQRLLPTDPLRSTCSLMGLYPNDLDWNEFLCRLEARFGVRFPDERCDDPTLAELIRWCAKGGKSA